MDHASEIREPCRRSLILSAIGASFAPGAFAAGPPTVVMLGDSVTAGLGLAAADALPAQLQAALAKIHRPERVVAAGVSGDTSADALARVDFSVPTGTALCLVELGGNDLLQGVDPVLLRANLVAIMRKLKARGVRAALIGLTAPPKVGASYARDFDAAFPAAAKAAGVPLYADWLADVADPALRQADGLHPTALGARVIAARLAPFVIKAQKSPA